MTLLDANATAWANSAWSWALRGAREMCQTYVDKLTDDQLDEVMTAAAVLIDIAGRHPEVEVRQ